MEISTVNFDDLFDFSPEPLDASSNDHTRTPPPQQQQQQQQQISQGSSNSRSPLVATKVAQTEGFKLSQSVPSNWGGSNYSQQGETGSSSASSFNTSVGQLLDDLPNPVGGSSSSGGRGKRGRKPGQRNLKTDMKSKLERSRQSARECRARKKLRYQYLDDLILEREKANVALRDELIKFQRWCHELDRGVIPEGLQELLQELKREKAAGR